MASRFSDRIQKVMHVSGYHAGDNILVEVDLGNTVSVCIWLMCSIGRENTVERCT